MSPLFRRAPAGHDRARELAALRIDEPLEPADAAWLDAHVAACADCAAVADAYDADRLLFGPLRETPLLPPRDLWARTAAAIDAGSGASRLGRRRGRRVMGLPAASLAPLAGVAVVAIVVGSALLNGAPFGPQPGGPSGPPPTPIAVAAGDVTMLSRGADGSYQLQTGSVDQVCPLVAEGCQAEPSFEATQVARIGTSVSVGAIISPDRDSLVVVQRGASGSDGIYVVPVKPGRETASPAAATPVPTGRAGSPAPTATPASTAPATPPVGSASPSQEPASPEATPSAPTAGPSDVPATEPPTEAPATTPEPTDEPAPTPTVAVTPGPDDAIQIASDVTVVGGVAAYNADGTRFAFTARPPDGSTGPDVYVWDTTDTRARAITRDHRSIFAGWDGRVLLVSRVEDGTPRTFAVDPRTGEVGAEQGHEAWLPTVAPDGTRAAWWDGTVVLAADGVTWVPDKGRLVIGEWPGAPGDEQVLAKGDLRAWEVRWDAAGTSVGVWAGGTDPGKAGRLSLYPVDPDTGRVTLGSPILDDTPAFEGFSLKSGRIVYPGPGADGKRSLWVVAWDGQTVGRVELPGEDGATVVR